MALLDSISKEAFARQRKLFLLIFVSFMGAVALGAIAAQEPLLAIGGVLGAVLMLVLLRWPNTVTLLVIFYIYTNVGPVATRFHGLPYFITLGFPVILIVPLVWYFVLLRQKPVITPVLILLLMLFTIYMFGAAFSKDIQLALPQLAEFFIEGLLLYFILTNIIRTPLMLKRVVWVLLISGALIGGLSLFQQVTRTFDNDYGGFAQVAGTILTGVENLQGEIRQPRLMGSIGEQNRYAQNMLMLVPLGLLQLWIYRSLRLRLLTLLLTGLIIVGGALTFSRGAAVGFVLMILIMVFLRYVKIHQLMLLILGASLILWAFPEYGPRLASLNVIAALASQENGPPLAGADNSVMDRSSLMIAALMVFRDHPVVGVGPGMVRYYTQEYARQIGMSSITGDFQAHNLLLGIAADAGLFGLICFLLILFIPLRDLARVRKQWMESHPDWSYLATGFLQALFSYIVTGLFLHLSYYRFFYLMLALAVVASRLGEMHKVSESEDDLSSVQPNRNVE